MTDTFNNPIALPEAGATPSAPPSGRQKVYGKADGKLYSLNSAGVEYDLTQGGGADLSDSPAQDLGTSSAGTSDEASRADHVHEKNTRLYNSGGEVASPIKIWTGKVTTDGDGSLTVDYSSAGFSAPPVVSLSAHSDSTNTTRDRAWSTLQGSPTATSARIYTIRGALISGASSIRTAPNVKVDVMAVGI